MTNELIFDASVFDFVETQNTLIVQIKLDLYDELLGQLQKAVLNYVKEKDLSGVIIDLSAIQIIDSVNLKALLELANMIRLLGSQVIFTGFQPGVAAALTELPDLQLQGVVSSMNMETAILALARKTRLKR